MKIWFNKLHESRRTMIEVRDTTVHLGRDPANTIVLSSPLVSKRHAVVTWDGAKFRLENIGMNGCEVGDQEVLGGEIAEFQPGVRVRIWPFTLTFEAESPAQITPRQLEAHLRRVSAELELRIHKKLLERFDLVELETSRIGDPETALMLENHIDDICRELNLFGSENEPLLEEITGLTLRDSLINQLILESRENEDVPNSWTAGEFAVSSTLVPEREMELENLLSHARKKLKLDEAPDLSAKIELVENGFAGVFPIIRPHLHRELRRYIVLRMLKKDLKDTVFGYGPLQDLLRAPTINEIMVVRSDQIYVEKHGVTELSGRRFLSDKVTESIIERIVAQVGRRIDKSQPMVDARLPDGSRVNAIIPPLAVRGPCLTIRKFPAYRFTVDDLIDFGTITPSAAVFLRACVIHRKNILVSGGTGTGKTTLLNVLSSFIPRKERIVTIEDTTELQLQQDHVVTLETKQANVEGAGAYTIRDLVRNALRMRPDRILVGECRGAEAIDMLQAMNTGHDGSMTTVHANSSEEVIKRLEVLVLMAVDLPVSSIHRQIASAVNLVVQISRTSGGKRMVSQISEITGIDPETKQITLMDIYNCRDGRSLRPTGYLPSFIDELIERGLLQLEFLYGAGSEEMRSAQPGRATRSNSSSGVSGGPPPSVVVMKPTGGGSTGGDPANAPATGSASSGS
jgi:Flp pilus assembly CpaF family ATPase